MAEIIKFPDKHNSDHKLPDFLIDDTSDETKEAFEALMHLKTPSLSKNSFVYLGYLDLIQGIFGEVVSSNLQNVFCSTDSFQFTSGGVKREIIGLIGSGISSFQAIDSIKQVMRERGMNIFAIRTIIIDPVNSKILIFMNGEIENIEIPYIPQYNGMENIEI